jgi:hypothetical protein
MHDHHGPDYLEVLRLRKENLALRKKLDDAERLKAAKVKPPIVAAEGPQVKPPEVISPYTLFRDLVRADLEHNLSWGSFKYGPETYEFAFILRSMCPSCYEFMRTIIPLPGLNHVDARFADEVQQTKQFMTGLDAESLLQALAICRDPYIAPDYDNGVVGEGEFGKDYYKKDTRGHNSLIPCILGVDAMAIEPYTVPRVVDPENLPEPNRPPGKNYSYFFAHYLMPLDPVLPSLVVSVVPQIHGKANRDTLADLDTIRTTCLQSGFWVVASSGDGDTTYDHFTREIYEQIHSDSGRSRSYLDFIHHMQTIEKPFVTDFLHFAKCLRNRLTNHPLSLDDRLPFFSGTEVAACLNIGDCLSHHSPGSQLKDSIALRVFSLENLVILLNKGFYRSQLLVRIGTVLSDLRRN